MKKRFSEEQNIGILKEQEAGFAVKDIISRPVLHYASRREDDGPARSRLKALAVQYRRYGYLRLHVFLRKVRSRGECQANLSPLL